MDPSVMHRMMMSDSSAKTATLTPGLVKRVWGFAHEYRTRVFGFLFVVVAEAFLGLAPALVIKRIIDDAIPAKDTGQVTLLAGIMIVAAFGGAILGMVERWLSATIGEGLIYDLRSALFDHV